MPPPVTDQDLHRLLDLQNEDSEIARLGRRRASLPEARRLAELNEKLAELQADLDIAAKQNEELAREQARIEGEGEILATKITREEGRLFSGSVSNPKELGALQQEVEMLKRQRAGHEDGLLEVMVQKDQAAEMVDRLTAERDATSAEADQVGATVNELLADLDRALTEHSTKRSGLAARVPADLLTLYDKIRQQKGGVGAAALAGNTCEGCHTSLPAKEVERVKAEKGLQRCDNCRRILVVT